MLYQVEGTVKTDRTEDVDRYLALARTAQKAGNNADAEKYASMALEIDLKNAEAWSIKAKAIDWQLTFDNDRLSESNAACINMLKLLNRAPSDFDEINTALNIAIGFIEHLRAIANSEIDYFCQELANLPNAKNLELIQSGLIRHLQSRELQWQKYRGRVRITNGCRKEAQQRARGRVPRYPRISKISSAPLPKTFPVLQRATFHQCITMLQSRS